MYNHYRGKQFVYRLELINHLSSSWDHSLNNVLSVIIIVNLASSLERWLPLFVLSVQRIVNNLWSFHPVLIVYPFSMNIRWWGLLCYRIQKTDLKEWKSADTQQNWLHTAAINFHGDEIFWLCPVGLTEEVVNICPCYWQNVQTWGWMYTLVAVIMVWVETCLYYRMHKHLWEEEDEWCTHHEPLLHKICICRSLSYNGD